MSCWFRSWRSLDQFLPLPSHCLVPRACVSCCWHPECLHLHYTERTIMTCSQRSVLHSHTLFRAGSLIGPAAEGHDPGTVHCGSAADRAVQCAPELTVSEWKYQIRCCCGSRVSCALWLAERTGTAGFAVPRQPRPRCQHRGENQRQGCKILHRHTSIQTGLLTDGLNKAAAQASSLYFEHYHPVVMSCLANCC